MNILLTGINGQVGFELQRSLAPLGHLVCASSTGRTPAGEPCETIDLAQTQSLPSLLDRLQPDIIVNPAAYTAVDRAESEPELAHRINADGPAGLARWCLERGALLLHFSTDYVFNGRATMPWREHDEVAPLGVYGSSKLAGECAIRQTGCRHLILRTAWVYSARFNNFLRTMLRLGGQRDELRVVDDQRGAPTTARGLAAVSAALLARADRFEADQLGTFHCVHAGEASWHEFAEAIFECAVRAGKLAKSPRVLAIPSSDYPTPARRPAYSVLDCARLRAIHQLALPHWRQGLAEVIAELR